MILGIIFRVLKGDILKKYIQVAKILQKNKPSKKIVFLELDLLCSECIMEKVNILSTMD